MTADADKTVTAPFTLQHQLSVTLAGAGSGTITGTGTFSCTSGTCTKYYDTGTAVTLSSSQGATSQAVAYSGDCTGSSCAPTMSAPRTVTATFTLCPGARLGFTISNVAPCDVPEPGTALTLSGTININANSNTVKDGGLVLVPGVVSSIVTQNSGAYEAMVISQDSVSIASGASVYVVGSRPLIIVAQGDLTITGTIDASASMSAGGPGAELNCSTRQWQ